MIDENMKNELEKKVSDLTSVYMGMLNELARIHDNKEIIEQQLKQEEKNFNQMHIVIDCVYGRLNEAKKSLNLIYNNDDKFIPMNKFVFDRNMVKLEEEGQEQK